MPEVGGVGLFVAFAAGLLSCASPCVLPLVPAYLGYLTGASSPAVSVSGPGAVAATAVGTRATPSPFFHALSFVSGFSLVFVILGTSIGGIGFLLRDAQEVLAKAAGVLLIILGLHLSGGITIPFLEQERRWQDSPPRRPGYCRPLL